MFLDDELKEIYEKYDVSTKDGITKCVSEIMNVCRKRCVACNPYDFANKLKQVDGSYRLFCEKSKAPFKKYAFRTYMWKLLGGDECCKNVYKHILHWEIPSE